MSKTLSEITQDAISTHTRWRDHLGMECINGVAGWWVRWVGTGEALAGPFETYAQAATWIERYKMHRLAHEKPPEP